jgi:thiamine-phosphate pyrophosphorylase
LDKIIIITHPGRISEEVSICKKLLAAGLGSLHVRKPKWSDARLIEWIGEFSKEELKKMVIHHNYDLFEKFTLGGFHISYSPAVPDVKQGTLSCSVHNWKEAEDALTKCDYVFISPLFDSISKDGYKKNPELTIIPSDLRGKKIIALGGIDDNTIEEVFDIGYYGAAVLGYIWNNPDNAVKNYEKLNNLIHV